MYDEPATAYFDDDASEARFKSEASGHRAIHLATHGYYLGSKCKPESSDNSSRSYHGFADDHPLLMSGLFLAGANLRRKYTDSLYAEDGVLTALEVSGMNLNGVDLVVLSACETGLGEI
jgi:CHAT domain-containing protein